jgi:hypothetical protein
MAVEATGSQFARKNAIIFFVVSLGIGLYFFHDGWLGWFGGYMQKQLDEGGGKPTLDLQFNRYAPFVLWIVSVYSLIGYIRIPKRRLVADDTGLTVQDQPAIPYTSITHIDNRQFKKSGYFLVGVNDGGQKKELKFSDRKYDNLGLLLDELIKQTGAKPESEVKSDSDAAT